MARRDTPAALPDTSTIPGVKLCSIPGCVDGHNAMGMCLRHYQQRQYWANPEHYRAKRRARYARSKARGAAA